MSNNKKALIKAAQKTARDALMNSNHAVNPVGALVVYDPVSGWNKDAREVRDAFARANIDPYVYLPEIPDYGTAFSRTILAIRPMIHNRGYTLLAAGNGPNGESRYSVVSVARNGTVQTSDCATVQCPKDGSAPFLERSTGDQVADEVAGWIVQASHERFEKYTSEDVRQSIVKTLDMYAAVPVRNSKPYVCYWIAQAGAEVLTQLSTVLESLGWGEIQQFQGALTDSNIAFASKAVNNTLDAQLSEFSEQCDAYASKSGNMYESTIAKRIEDAKALKSKAELYTAILGAAVASVDDRVKAIEASLMTTLGMMITAP